MWDNKNSKDIIGSYNSLKDPHLKIHFRKPQIRRHLLKANIINKDNKIVEEISKTRHQQNVERKHKRELYQMLNEMVNQDEKQSEEKPYLTDEFLRHLLLNNDSQFGNYGPYQNATSNQQRMILLQKLDRMIKIIKEHNEQDPKKIHNKIIKTTLRNSKSQLDVSLDSSENNSESFKSYLSTPQLTKLSSRPKSSYGRMRMKINVSKDDGTIKNQKSKTNLKKCISLANVRLEENNDFDEIKSLDGESLNDTETNNENDQQLMCLFKNTKKLSPMIFAVENHNNKKYYAFDKRFVKSSGRQRVKMTLLYNGISEATNVGGKRNIKIYQQITVGGNSILIYDGSVNPGEAFTFDIRPHISNSFAINILVNGIRDLRLNTCCERKHRPGTKLSHFTIVDIVGGRACFNCQMSVSKYNNNVFHNNNNSNNNSNNSNKKNNYNNDEDGDEYENIHDENEMIYLSRTSENKEQTFRKHQNGLDVVVVNDQDQENQMLATETKNIHNTNLESLSSSSSSIFVTNVQENRDNIQDMENRDNKKWAKDNNEIYSRHKKLEHHPISSINHCDKDPIGVDEQMFCDISNETIPQIKNLTSDDDEDDSKY